jgi:hypothetical protein
MDGLDDCEKREASVGLLGGPESCGMAVLEAEWCAGDITPMHLQEALQRGIFSD